MVPEQDCRAALVPSQRVGPHGMAFCQQGQAIGAPVHVMEVEANDAGACHAGTDQ